MGLLNRTPPEVRALVPRGERLLAWSAVWPGGSAEPPLSGSPARYAVATDTALYLPVPETLRLAWDLVAKASFSDEAVLVVEGRLEPRGRDRAWRVVLDDPGNLPTVVYERVTSSVVVSERVVLRDDLGARIVARRAGDGLRWTVTFDPGLDPRDQVLRAEVDAVLAELRSTLGV